MERESEMRRHKERGGEGKRNEETRREVERESEMRRHKERWRGQEKCGNIKRGGVGKRNGET